MIFLARCTLCLSIVYAAILGFAVPRTQMRPNAERATASHAAAREGIDRSLLTLCRERPSDCLAAVAAMTRFAHGPFDEAHAGSGATPTTVADPAQLRHRRPGFSADADALSR